MGVHLGVVLGTADLIDRFDEVLRGWGVTWGPWWTLLAAAVALVGVWLLGQMVVVLWEEFEYWALAGLAGGVVIVCLVVNWFVSLPGPWPAVLTAVLVAAAAFAIAMALFAYAEDVAARYEDVWLAAAWAMGGIGAAVTSLVVLANFNEPRWLFWTLIVVIVIGAAIFVGAAGFGVLAVIHERRADYGETEDTEPWPVTWVRSPLDDPDAEPNSPSAPPDAPARSVAPSGRPRQRAHRTVRAPAGPGHQTLPEVLHLPRGAPESATESVRSEVPWWRDQQRLAAWGVLATLLNALLVFLTTLVKTMAELF